MLRYAVILILLFTVSSLAEENNYLEPGSGFYSNSGYRTYYHGSDYPEAFFSVFPSFTDSYVLTFVKDSTDNYKMFLIVHSEGRKTLLIDRELFDLVINLYRIALKKTIKIENWGRLDGTRYIFTLFESDTKYTTGYTWSPKEGSKMDRLVMLVNQLAHMVYDSDNDFEDIKNEIYEFTRELLIHYILRLEIGIPAWK